MQRSQSAFYAQPITLGSKSYRFPIGFNLRSSPIWERGTKNLTKEQIDAECLKEYNNKLKRCKEYCQKIENWETRAELLELSIALNDKYSLIRRCDVVEGLRCDLLRAFSDVSCHIEAVNFEQVEEAGYQIVWIAEKLLEIDSNLEIEIDYQQIIRRTTDNLRYWDSLAATDGERNVAFKKRYVGARAFLKAYSPHTLSEHDAMQFKKKLINKIWKVSEDLICFSIGAMVTSAVMLYYNHE